MALPEAGDHGLAAPRGGPKARITRGRAPILRQLPGRGRPGGAAFPATYHTQGSGTMILLDTDTLTHHVYANDNVRRRLEAAADQPWAVTVVTRYEVLRGRTESLLKAANEDELRKAVERLGRAEEMLSFFAVVGFDD